MGGYYLIGVSNVTGTAVPSGGTRLSLLFSRTGNVGAQGTQGNQGRQGIQGVQGIQGQQGQGVQGIQGHNSG